MNNYFEIDRKRILDYLDALTLSVYSLGKKKKTRENMYVLINRISYLRSWVELDLLPCNYGNGTAIDTVDEYRNNIVRYSIHKDVFFEQNSLEKIIEDQMLEKWATLEEENTLSLS